MSPGTQPTSRAEGASPTLSLYHLLDPEVLADPYPLFHRLRSEAPVHWDPFLHAWVVTRYPDVLEVLHSYSANRTPTPEQLAAMGLQQLGPIAQLMVKQMLFMDASQHGRLRGLASRAFTPARIEVLRSHIVEIVDRLLDEFAERRSMDVIADLGEPLPSIITAEMLGVPVEDRHRLKKWSANFAEMLGNFQHNPEHAQIMLTTVEEMTAYFRDAVIETRRQPREGLIHSLLTAEIDGDRLSDEEVVANVIITMVGGQETTTNLIGNGVLTLLRHPQQMEKLRGNLSLIPSAVEEMLRFESPSQHTARLAPSDRELGGKQIRKRQAVIAVMAAANRDPERFPDPDRFDITREDNRHLAFGYAAHFCFGAPLARLEGQIAFEALLRRFPSFRLEPQNLVWRTNLGLRGLTSLKIAIDRGGSATKARPEQESNEKNKAGPETVTSSSPAVGVAPSLPESRASAPAAGLEQHSPALSCRSMHSSTGRAAGGEDSAGSGCRDGVAENDLCGAEPLRQSTGASTAQEGCRSRSAGRDLPQAFARIAGGVAGRPEGGRRVRAARSRLSQRTSHAYSSRLAGPGSHHAARTTFSDRTNGCRSPSPRTGLGDSRKREQREFIDGSAA